jgi:hypothetical protein
MSKHLIAALAALTLAAPIAAQAQVVPSYAASYATSEEDVHGRIVSFDGAYSLQVRDERGFIDNVQLHDGTIINPTGLTLADGMIVNILGYDAGGYLAANEIDTPYTYADGAWCYAGHPWNYYGADFNLAFFFGNAGWWHGTYFAGPYAWNGGVRIYNDVTYKTVYRTANVYRVVDKRPVPIPIDKPPTYHKQVPIPVDHPPVVNHGTDRSLASRPAPVYEHPVPLADNAHNAPSHQTSAPARASRPSEDRERR